MEFHMHGLRNKYVHADTKMWGSGVSGLTVKALARNARDVGSNPTCSQFFQQVDVSKKIYLR